MSNREMPALKILGLTRRDNCRWCGALSCMAFAIAVSQGARPLADCPYIANAEEHANELAPVASRQTGESPAGLENALSAAQRKIRELDLAEQAQRLGLPFEDGCVVVPVLGRRFALDAEGGLHSESHVNPWVHLPVFQLVVRAAARPLSGEWVAYKELRGAVDWELFFGHSCELGIQHLNNRDPDLLEHLLEVLSSDPPVGLVPDEPCTADQVAYLPLLPGVSLLVRRWLPERDFKAQISLLFDFACGENLDPGSIFFMMRGLIEMFRKLEARHGSGAVR
jgi:hypothetical protein